MTQEFRTFTQRLTDKPNGKTRVFNVRAKTIVDRFGNDVIDVEGNKIWFPENFDPAAAITFGRSLASESTVNAAQALRHAVRQGGPWDLQRSYNGQSNALFASLFTSAASYTYGLIGAAAGFSPTTLMAGGGMYNLLMNPKTAGPNFGNNPNNPPFISKGVQDFFASSYGSPAIIPDNSFQGSPAFTRPIDRFTTTFDRLSKSALDDVNPVVASAATGNITPSVGFSDLTNANRYAGSFPKALDSVTSFGRGGWLSSMRRNGDVERIMRNNAVYSPAGNFFGNFPRGSADATTRLPTTFKTSGSAVGSRITDDFGGTGKGPMGVLGGLIGNSSMDPVGARPQIRGVGAADSSSEEINAVDPSENASAVPRPATYPWLRRGSSASPGFMPLDPEQPVTQPKPAASLGIFSGEPMLPLPQAVWGFPDRSSASPGGTLFDFLAGLTRRNPATVPLNDGSRGFNRDDQAQAWFDQRQR